MTNLPSPVLFVPIISLLLLIGAPEAYCRPVAPESKVPAADNGTVSPDRRFNEFNSLVRDGRIGRSAAVLKLNALLKELKLEYYGKSGTDVPKSDWVFPLEGYDARSITGGRNKGYVASGYDYFSGNRHGGHPSFDIFIRDRNQDCMDDRSGKPVRVLSLGAGIVVAMEAQWDQNSKLRGGKYVWVYDPGNDLLVYYAHNGGLSVGLGQIVKPGDLLATVGRSGLNAARRRSPTHLHLTVLRIQNGRLLPLNVYGDLVRAGKAVSRK